MESTATIAAACELLRTERADEAANILSREYPFVPTQAIERKYGEVEAARVFVRDGFVDRYSGKRLVFPGVLRVLSLRFPEHFPFHPNWKMSATHIAFWELSPTVDHLVPVARGGSDSSENWVTTSMLRNSAKSNWTLDELGWHLHPPGSITAWDGMLSWFTEYVDTHADVATNPLVRRWLRAAVAVGSGACSPSST